MSDVLYHSGLAFALTVGFSVLFNAPRRSLIACGVTAVLGYLAKYFALEMGLVLPGASFIGAAVVGLVAEIFALIFRLPATVFVVAGFVPLLPGVAAVRSMYQVLSGDTINGGQNAINVVLNTAALAAGIGGLGAAARAFRVHYIA